jgi:energy-coupling factor transporter ATP-binding protein EcfA2
MSKTRKHSNDLKSLSHRKRVLVIGPCTCGKTTFVQSIQDGLHSVVEDDVFYGRHEVADELPTDLWREYVSYLVRDAQATITTLHPDELWCDQPFLSEQVDSTIVLFDPIRNADNLMVRWLVQERNFCKGQSVAKIKAWASHDLYLMRQIKRLRPDAIHCKSFPEIDGICALLASHSLCPHEEYSQLESRISAVTQRTLDRATDLWGGYHAG